MRNIKADVAQTPLRQTLRRAAVAQMDVWLLPGGERWDEEGGVQGLAGGDGLSGGGRREVGTR